MQITHSLRAIGNVISYLEVNTLLPRWCYPWYASPLRQEGTSYSATSWCLPLLTPRSKCTKASSRGGGAEGQSINRAAKQARISWKASMQEYRVLWGDERRRSVSIYWVFAARVPFSTWPGLASLSSCRRTTCSVWLQSQELASPLVRLRGCQASLQAQCKGFYLE